MREVVYTRSLPLATRSLDIVPQTLGNSSGLLGGAYLAIEHRLQPDAVDRELERRLGAGASLGAWVCPGWSRGAAEYGGRCGGLGRGPGLIRPIPRKRFVPRRNTMFALSRLLSPTFAVALPPSSSRSAAPPSRPARSPARTRPRPCCKMRVTKDGKLIGTDNDGTVKKAGVGIYDITFSAGPTGSKVPLDLEKCAIVATPRVETASNPEEVAADVDVQRLGGARIFVESTRLLPFGENKITPFLTNVSFDVAAIC